MNPSRSALHNAIFPKLSRLANRAAAAMEKRTTEGLALYEKLAAQCRPLRQITEALDVAFYMHPPGSATVRAVEEHLGRDVREDVAAAIVEEAQCAAAWAAHRAAEIAAERAATASARKYEAEWLASLDRRGAQ